MNQGFKNKAWEVLVHNDNIVGDLDMLDRFFANADGSWLFRGRGNAQWNIKSSLERAEEESRGAMFRQQTEGESELYKKENAMITKFKELIRWDHYLGEDKMQYLAAMQHYGIPTRMVDFTESFSVGLFFAIQGRYKTYDAGNTRIVWAVNEKLLDDMAEPYKQFYKRKNPNMSDDDFQRAFLNSFFDEKKMTVVKHGLFVTRLEGNNPRLIAQRGVFLVPYSPMSFMENFESAINCRFFKGENVDVKLIDQKDLSKVAVIKISIQDTIREGVKNWLSRRGWTCKTIFPDMEGIQKDIKQQFHYEDLMC